MWKDAHFAYLRYIFERSLDGARQPDLLHARQPGHRRVPAPVPRAAPCRRTWTATRTRTTTTCNDDGTRTTGSPIREGYIRAAYHGGRRDARARPRADAAATRRHVRRAPTTASRRSGTRSTPARCSSDAGLQAREQIVATAAIARRAGGRPGEGVLGRRHRADLRQPRSAAIRPASSRRRSTRPCATQIIAAFQNLTDPANPGKQVVLKIMQEGGAAQRRRHRLAASEPSGDVVVVLRPPYQFDAATPGQTIAFSQFFGQHGYLPDLVDLDRQRQHARHVRRRRPRHPQQRPLTGRPRDRRRADARVPDGHPRAAERARQDPLQDLPGRADRLREITILNISDWHAQLTPLTEAADNVAGARRGEPDVRDRRRGVPRSRGSTCTGARRRNGSLTMAGGDSFGGATPPISNFFGDRPTIEIMNLMGFDADAVGNHSFDRGEEYFRKELIPLADFPILSANVVDGRAARRRPSGRRRTIFTTSTASSSGVDRLHDRGHAEARLPGQPRPVPGVDRSCRR